MSLTECDRQAIRMELQFDREKTAHFSPDYVPADIAHLDLAPRPTAPNKINRLPRIDGLTPLPMNPDPTKEANRVYVVCHPTYGNLCVMTSPVDAAEIVKKLLDARVESFVLNAT